MKKPTNTLGLDVGEKRVGVAIIADGLAMARTMPTLNHDDKLMDCLRTIISDRSIEQLVLGLPRNLAGDETPQTVYVRQFADQLKQQTGLPIIFQDEALTSVHAEQSLRATGKIFAKGDIDGLAAQAILNDYLESVVVSR